VALLSLTLTNPGKKKRLQIMMKNQTFIVLVQFIIINLFCQQHSTCLSFTTSGTTTTSHQIKRSPTIRFQTTNDEEYNDSRRVLFQKSLAMLLFTSTVATTNNPIPSFLLPKASTSYSSSYASAATAPEFVQKYEDFTATKEGWSYKDATVGRSDVTIREGDRVVFDWSGYTIGYFGRPFEAKGGPQGGAFDKDLDYSRTVIGSHKVIPALEQALVTMKPGGVRQVIVPYGPLSYPPEDLEHVKVGPKPTTFSGQRALNFVLENPRVDRTLLLNVKCIRVDKANGSGGFTRG